MIGRNENEKFQNVIKFKVLLTDHIYTEQKVIVNTEKKMREKTKHDMKERHQTTGKIKRKQRGTIKYQKMQFHF